MKNIIAIALLALGTVAASAVRISLPSGPWPDTLKELLATRLDRPPFAYKEENNGVQMRVQILTPWGQAVDAARKAQLAGGEITQPDAEAIMSGGIVRVRMVLLMPFAPNSSQVHAMFQFREGERVVHPISEETTFKPQGSQYNQFITETESVFDLAALEAADKAAKLSMKDQIVVNWGPAMNCKAHFRFKDLR